MGGVFKQKDNETIINKEKNSYLAIILKQNKSIGFKWISFTDNEFRFDRNTYFTIPEGVYLSSEKVLISVYLEGISTPLGHKNVKKKTVKRIIKLDNGNEEEIPIEVIDGLKYDSEIIDILLNRGLAEKLTELKPDKTIFILIVMMIISIIVGIVSVGVEFA